MPLGVATRRVRQRYSKPLYTARMTAAEQAALRQLRQLAGLGGDSAFCQRDNPEREPHCLMSREALRKFIHGEIPRHHLQIVV